MYRPVIVSVIVMLATLIAAANGAESTSTRQRAALLLKQKQSEMLEKRILETRPRRRDTPARAVNITNEEVQEIRAVAAKVMRGDIVNIGTVVTGCPCEDGTSCTEQVWILGNRAGRISGLLLSKIDKHWQLGPMQRWWLEFESVERNSQKLRTSSEYYKALDDVKQKFPVCP